VNTCQLLSAEVTRSKQENPHKSCW